MALTLPDFSFEQIYHANHLVIGVDEVGRGPLAGPVVAAAVMIAPLHYGLDLWSEVNDSKKISAQKRAHLFNLIQTHSSYGIGVCSVEEIDKINILNASFLAMKRAISALLQSLQTYPTPSTLPPYILIDGKLKPKHWDWPSTAIIKGDTKSVSIAAASILAKVTRDRMMEHYARDYPAYGWDQNAGYGTPHHLCALTSHGITRHHRRSFAPIRNLINTPFKNGCAA
ncbi:MAG: ribonuclease HII [Alphaproteobacteria bacterium]|nr:ribonuclease HII [Alphaproteobacteria bacterium]